MSDASSVTVLITCEHGGNEIPGTWQHLFAAAADVLTTHRAYDPGALSLAKRFSRELQAPLIFSAVSRLLIELNRSPGHPKLFSEFTRQLEDDLRDSLIKKFYDPYREQVRSAIDDGIRTESKVLHLSVHSFTPLWEGVERPIDVGLLYDPRRPGEMAFCNHWYKSLQTIDRDLRVRRNAPYKGISDGLVTHLRRQFGPDKYIGIELEVNQRYPLTNRAEWKSLQTDLIETFLASLDAVG